MNEIKWVKLSVDMFDDEKIRLLEKLPEGDTMIVIWCKLLTMAGKSNHKGYIMLTENFPYTEEMLTTIIDRPAVTVKMALQTFQRFGMIDFDDSENAFYLPNWIKHQNIEGMERQKELTRQRVQKHRQRKRLEQSIYPCVYCGEPSSGKDHVIATARGGLDEDSNKVDCCEECNRIKNDKPIIDFLNGNRARIKDDSIQENEILSSHVTLCNVTGRYISNDSVTESNASRKKKEERREKKDLSRQQVDYETDFNEFYQVYPKKVDKKAALRAYVKARKDKVEHAVIVKGAIGYANECIQSNTEKRYMKNPATWLNAGSYLDYQDDSNHTLDAANNTDYTQYKPLQKGWDFNARGNDSV